MPKIPIVLSETMLEAGYKQYIQWDTEAAPHLAVSGVTGTGKTYCTKLIRVFLFDIILNKDK